MDYNIAMRPGPRFRIIRDGLNLSQDEIGKRIGQARQVVSRFESEGNDPKLSVLESFLSAVGVSLAEFFGSKIPNKYADPAHAALHEQLQQILESDDDASIRCIMKAIEAFNQASQKGNRTKASRQEMKRRAS